MRFRQHTKLSPVYPSGRCSVVIRVTSQGKRIELYTGITLRPSQWNGNKERVKQGCNVDGLMYNVKKQKINVETITVMEQDHVLLKKINLFVIVIY